MAGTYTVERSIHIDAPAAAIFPLVDDFHRWTWSPFEDLDPTMGRMYTGPEAGVGAVYDWAGNMRAGTGRMTIVDSEPDRRVVIEQVNLKPFKSTSTSTFTLLPAGDGTEVTWHTDGRTGMAGQVMGVFASMDKVIGPVFEKGLARLKADAETG